MSVPVFLEDGELNITSTFGKRIDPVTGVTTSFHAGIDITRWTGYSNLATICAYADGIVVQIRDGIAGFDKVRSEGNFVVIDHGGGYVSKYFHLANGTITVGENERVSAGQAIGYMGSSGYSTGAHLHFQLEYNNAPIDPLPYLTGEKSFISEEESEVCMDNNTPSEWAREAVEWAQANGILYGDENGDLKLREPCTREQMVVFLKRLHDLLRGRI